MKPVDVVRDQEVNLELLVKLNMKFLPAIDQLDLNLFIRDSRQTPGRLPGKQTLHGAAYGKKPNYDLAVKTSASRP